MNKIKKKIVFDARMINNSGIGRYIDKILSNTLPYFENIVILGNKQYLETRFKENNVSIIDFKDPFYSIAEQINYNKVIPQCDLFWSPHLNVPLFPIKAKKRLVTLHDVFHLAFYNTLTIPQKVYAKIVIKAALDKSDAIITVSNFSKDEILKYSGSKYATKIYPIHNGVDPILGSEDNHLADFRGYKNYFLAVGNIKPHKNFRRAIQAYNCFLQNNNKEEIPHLLIIGNSEGLITGDNSVFGEISNDPILKQYVHFIGRITDSELKTAYQNSLALIFPSIYEGFGFPPLEAMLEKTPVIVSNAACMPEICGDAALYFDPYNINDIATKMELIFKDKALREDIIVKGDKRVLDFKWAYSAQESIKVIENLLEI